MMYINPIVIAFLYIFENDVKVGLDRLLCLASLPLIVTNLGVTLTNCLSYTNSQLLKYNISIILLHSDLPCRMYTVCDPLFVSRMENKSVIDVKYIPHSHYECNNYNVIS